MRKSLLLLAIAALFFSCEKEDLNIVSPEQLNKTYLELKASNIDTSQCALSGSTTAVLGGYVDYTYSFGSSGGFIQLSEGMSLSQDVAGRINFTETFTCGAITIGNDDGCSKQLIILAPGLTTCDVYVTTESYDCYESEIVPISGPTYMNRNSMTWSFDGDESKIKTYRWWYKKVNGNGEAFVITYGQTGYFTASFDTYASDLRGNSFFEIYLEIIDVCGNNYYSRTYTIFKKGEYKLNSEY